MGLCYLLTLYALARGTESDGGRAWLPLSVIACIAGMAAKETMVTAPVVALGYDCIFVTRSLRQTLRLRRWYYVSLAATWLLLLSLMRTGLDERAVGYGLGVTWWSYALTECKAVLLYLKLSLWPHPLLFDYGVHFLTTVPSALPYLAGLLLVLGATVVALFQRPALGFVASCFFVLLAPTSSFVPIALQPFAENRTYLPTACVLVLVVCGLHAVLGRRSFTVFGLGGIALASLTICRNETYRSETALWSDTASKSPDNARAYDNWGVAELVAGRPSEALACFQHAAQINPESIATQNGLGDAFALLHRWPEAATHYSEVLRLKPGDASVHNNLGLALSEMGQTSTAIDHFVASVRLSPNYVHARRNLADALRAAGRFRDALPHYQRALELDPTHALTRNRYGVALAQAGEIAAAAQQFELAARDDPNLGEARANLAALRRAYPSVDGSPRSP